MREIGEVDYLLPGTITPARQFASIAVDADLPTLMGGTVQPLVGPVGAPKISGQDAFINRMGVGLTPLVAWTAPAVGTPTRYELSLFQLGISAMKTTKTPVATIITPEVQVQLPPGLLQPATKYFLLIFAIAEPNRNELRPFIPTLPSGHAVVLSGIFEP